VNLSVISFIIRIPRKVNITSISTFTFVVIMKTIRVHTKIIWMILASKISLVLLFFVVEKTRVPLFFVVKKTRNKPSNININPVFINIL